MRTGCREGTPFPLWKGSWVPQKLFSLFFDQKVKCFGAALFRVAE